jgi:hypothetical protein
MKHLSIIGLFITVSAFIGFPILFIKMSGSLWGIIPGLLFALFACRPTEHGKRWLWEKGVI